MRNLLVIDLLAINLSFNEFTDNPFLALILGLSVISPSIIHRDINNNIQLGDNPLCYIDILLSVSFNIYSFFVLFYIFAWYFYVYFILYFWLHTEKINIWFVDFFIYNILISAWTFFVGSPHTSFAFIQNPCYKK